MVDWLRGKGQLKMDGTWKRKQEKLRFAKQINTNTIGAIIYLHGLLHCELAMTEDDHIQRHLRDRTKCFWLADP